jgi:hypothetical protein
MGPFLRFIRASVCLRAAVLVACGGSPAKTYTYGVLYSLTTNGSVTCTSLDWSDSKGNLTTVPNPGASWAIQIPESSGDVVQADATCENPDGGSAMLAISAQADGSSYLDSDATSDAGLTTLHLRRVTLP